MDSSSALEEEALAIVSIYGPWSFYPLTGSAASATAQPLQDTPVYALKVSLEEPDFDLDLASSDRHQSSLDRYNKDINLSRARKELEFRIYFPKGYPATNTSAPVHEIVSIYYGSLRLTDAIIQEIDQGLEQCFVPGEVAVFSWIEWLRAFLEELEIRTQDNPHGHAEMHRTLVGEEEREGENEEEEEEDTDKQDDGEDELHASEGQRAASDYFAVDDSLQDVRGPATLSSSLASLSLHPSASSTDADSPRVPRPSGVPVFNIQSGPPIIDRKSVFVAHLAPITQSAQVPWMIVQLKQENKKVIKATHNIMAYRLVNENGSVSQGTRQLHWSHDNISAAYVYI